MMPRRSPWNVTTDDLENAFEHLRQGTRDQWESQWVAVPASGTATLTHTLGEIPWVIDVMRSETIEGAQPVDSNADVSVSKTDSQIVLTVTSTDITETRYYKVRAL